MIDKYLSKKFNLRSYNCFDFVREVWLELTGVDLGDQTPEEKTVKTYKEKALKVANTLKELKKPTSPCLVLFQANFIEPHIGVYLNSNVLHLTPKGAYYMPLFYVAIGYESVSFYK